MKKALLILGLILLIVAIVISIQLLKNRNNALSSEKEAIILNRDGRQIENKDEKNEAYRDSMIKTEEKIAYEGVTFGCTTEEYKQLIPKSENNIGGSSYTFTPAFNKEGRLYMLTIRSSAQQLQAIDDSMDNLKAVLTDKYGAPAVSNGYPPGEAIDPGVTQWAFKWIIGAKKINLGIAADRDGTSFYAVCSIFNEPLKNIAGGEGDPALQKKDASKF